MNIYILSLIVGLILIIALTFVLIKSLRNSRLNKKEDRLSESLFTEYGNVKWLTKYTIKWDGSKTTITEKMPYCRKCNVQYRQPTNESQQLPDLICPSCQERKRSYPLSANYRSALNITKETINKFERDLSITNDN